MTKRWRGWGKSRDTTMVSSAQVVSIFSLLALVLVPLLHIGVEGHWEIRFENLDDGHHDEMEPHSHDDHGQHHHGRKLAVCEQQNGDCEHEHGEEDEEQEVAELHQHGSSSHAHSHGDHDDDHGESQAHFHAHSRDQDDLAHADSHAHSADQHDDHGEHEAHSHSEHSHHSRAHAHDHDHDRGEHLPEEKRRVGQVGHFHSHGDDDDLAQTEKLTVGLWLRAMGCSLLVSLASLVCLLFLPLIVTGGKPSRRVVDALAGFGAGCMLGDALLHQLPHAFSGGHGEGGHSHAHDHHHSHEHEPTAGGENAHGHSLQDLSIGLAVLAGILLFFLVEKIVRRTEELSVEGHALGHSHHHHHHHNRGKKDDDEITKDDIYVEKTGKQSDSNSGLRKRKTSAVEESEKVDPSAVVKSEAEQEGRNGTKQQGNTSNFVLSYLNLFSDGVHNFTDGMALGSAFLLHGTVGGWSRTLFLLAHELPQEVGDFGILLRSGFGVFEALAFNFLSALMALAGTALALLVGGNPGHSSLIEGFTAGGFIYIAVGAVMPDMHSQGSNLRTTASQLASLSLGMGAAILISLAE